MDPFMTSLEMFVPPCSIEPLYDCVRGLLLHNYFSDYLQELLDAIFE